MDAPTTNVSTAAFEWPPASPIDAGVQKDAAAIVAATRDTTATVAAARETASAPGGSTVEAARDAAAIVDAALDRSTLDRSTLDGSGLDLSAGDGSGLSDLQRAILEFERRWWRQPGAKEQAIRDTFAMSPTRYYQALNSLLDLPQALGYDATLVHRLQRLRGSGVRGRRVS